MIDLKSALEVATATHPGMVRSHNEDSIAADAEIGLAVLADGMGGYNAGEVASGIAVELIKVEMKKALAGKRPDELNGSNAEQLIARLWWSRYGTTITCRSRISATRGFTGCAAARSSRSRATILCCRNR
jgi:hypothetical protein